MRLHEFEEEDYGIYEYLRAQGASKQVAREAVAAERRRTIEQLSKWYRHGWQWYGVKCDYTGAHDSLWGIDDEDYAERHVKPEIAEQVASQLEKEGYTVINQPQPEKRLTVRRYTKAVSVERGIHEDWYPHSMTADAWRDEFKRRLNSQNWKE